MGARHVEFVVVLGLSAVSCSSTGGGGLPHSDPECMAQVPMTVAAFVPSGAAVHCRDATTFDFEGRAVRLTHVEYGVLNDCAAGCFSSHVCAIEDPSVTAGPELFYAAWTIASERPTAVATECPSLLDTASETWPDCVPSGLRHPLVATRIFRNFAANEAGDGPLRWCVNRYALDDSWP